jgi:hypothetical protein
MNLTRGSEREGSALPSGAFIFLELNKSILNAFGILTLYSKNCREYSISVFIGPMRSLLYVKLLEEGSSDKIL